MTVTCEGEIWFVRVDGIIVASDTNVFAMTRLARRWGF